jgi:protein-L-isoaspartate(D-aspartate) O-methyltransferase
MAAPGNDFEAARRRMVSEHLVRRGIRDPLLLAAMGKVPRERFVGDRQVAFAYDDGPLPIGEGQTISQPYVVAVMVQALSLSRTDRVLEIGTGSGYSAAVLGEIVGEVYTVERLGPLAERARQRLADLRYTNVHVLVGDGTLGCPEHAPCDAIVATAGGPRVPTAFLAELVIGGRLVMPVGPVPYDQRLVRIVRAGDGNYRREELDPVEFVPRSSARRAGPRGGPLGDDAG